MNAYRQAMPAGRWWMLVLASLAGGLALRLDILWLAAGPLAPLPWPMTAAILGGIMGAGYGAITGLFLVWMLARSRVLPPGSGRGDEPMQGLATAPP